MMGGAAQTPDPFAAYGGGMGPAPAAAPVADPFAAYGGGMGPAPAAAPAQAPDSGVGGFVSGAWHNSVPGALIDAGTHPIRTATAALGALAHPIDTAKSLANVEGVNNYLKVSDDPNAKGPDKLRALAEAFPLVGPALKDVQDSYDKGDHSGALGKVVGLLTNLLTPEAAESAATGVGAEKTAAAISTARALPGQAVAKVAGKVGSKLDAIRPTEVNIGGVQVPVLRSQLEGGSKVGGATRANSPKFARAQDIKAREVMTNQPQEAYKRAIDQINQSRQAVVPITDEARLLQPPSDEPEFSHTLQTGPAPEEERTGPSLVDPRKKQTGTTVEAGNPNAETNSKGVRKVPTFQYLTGAKPGTEAREISVKGAGTVNLSNYNQATAALGNLEDAMKDDDFQKLSLENQQSIVDQHTQLSEALRMHHASRPSGPAGPTSNPRFNPIDPNDALPHIETNRDAGRHLEAAVAPVFQKFDELSGGTFSDLRRQERQAESIIYGGKPKSMGAITKAKASAAEASQGLNDIFEMARQSGQVTRGDWDAARIGYRTGKLMERVHPTIEGAYNGVSADREASTAAQGQKVTRQITGLTTDRLGKIEEGFTPEEKHLVFGEDGLDNIYRLADILKDPVQAPELKSLTHEIGIHHSGRAGKGAYAGSLLGGAAGSMFGPAGAAGGAVLGGSAGALGEGLYRNITHKLASTPKAGKLAEYAVRNRVNPKISVPLVARALGMGIQSANAGDAQ